MTRRAWRRTSVGLAWLAIAARAATAQVTTSTAASVLVFPKVIVDATWDTSIQISNTANRPARAICHYVDGVPANPDLPPGPNNPAQWVQIDFTIGLGRQQPTHWVASRGRTTDPTDDVCDDPSQGCDGTGSDPGRIPELPAGFRGELICYEVDASGAPWSGDAFTAQATLTHLATGEVVKYPAIGLPGLPANDADDRLCLGGAARAGCSLGAEYGACPSEWTLAQPSSFDDRPVDGDAQRTRFAIAPCAHDFDSQAPAHLTLSLLVTTELEEQFSTAVAVDCWADLALTDIGPIFDRDTVGADWIATRIRAIGSNPSGFVVVQENEREAVRPFAFAATASPGHAGAVAEQGDLIVVPREVAP